MDTGPVVANAAKENGSYRKSRSFRCLSQLRIMQVGAREDRVGGVSNRQRGHRLRLIEPNEKLGLD